MVGILWGGEPI